MPRNLQTITNNMSSTADPYALFNDWYTQAQAKESDLPNAVALATASTEGMPSVRMVLLKGVDERGFVFYTNMESRKGCELRTNAKAALCFHWKTLQKQVRVEGHFAPVDDDEANAYFESRDRSSQIGAWASRQSRPLKGRFELEKEVAKYAARFHVGKVPRPEYWTGCRIDPVRIEFWSEGAFRLHDRVEYSKSNNSWARRNLFP
ncbi:MAG: pyridoxamine 5'-phosphate oxidase [Thiotrichales bacterium]|nr:pyridoxamine 5'-phosphate oxidase [Thiotrichales bacterium]